MEHLKEKSAMPSGYYDPSVVNPSVPAPSHFYMYSQYQQSSNPSNYVNYMPPYNWPTPAFFACPSMMMRDSSSKADMGKKKTKFTNFQITKLKERFLQKNSIRLPERKIFAEAIGLTSDQVKIWFQNRRYNLRKQGKLIEDDTIEDSTEHEPILNSSETFSEEDVHNDSNSPVSIGSLASLGNTTFSTSSSSTPSTNWMDSIPNMSENPACPGFFGQPPVMSIPNMVLDGYQLGEYPHHQQQHQFPELF